MEQQYYEYQSLTTLFNTGPNQDANLARRLNSLGTLSGLGWELVTSVMSDAASLAGMRALLLVDTLRRPTA